MSCRRRNVVVRKVDGIDLLGPHETLRVFAVNAGVQEKGEQLPSVRIESSSAFIAKRTNVAFTSP